MGLVHRTKIIASRRANHTHKSGQGAGP
jgi:hypothetical protein